MKIKTEFKFVLPGDTEGGEKVRGTMRLIKVKDLIDVHRDTRVKESSAYFYVVLLARVIVKLGKERIVNTKIIESLSTRDFSFLVDFLNEINHKVLMNFPVKCNECGTMYSGDLNLVGEQ